MVLYGVCVSVFACLACASMLFSVKFHVVLREVWMLQKHGFCGLRWGLGMDFLFLFELFQIFSFLLFALC